LSTAKLHVIGSAHQARFSESFDAELTRAIQAAHDPARAARDLDELSLLSVLAHYAAAGRYDPDQPDLKQMWSLEPVPSDPRVRRHQYVVHYSATRVGRLCVRRHCSHSRSDHRRLS
jgi:hypothetical protein